MLPRNIIRSCFAGAVATTLLSACNIANTPKISMSVVKPDTIEFGRSVADIEATLNGYCASITTRAIEPPRFPDVDSQTQIDCEGFGYFGGQRLAEFVFINDALMLTWILVDAEEIAALEAAFIQEYGPPTAAKDTILSFANDFAGVRNDTPEALYYAEAAAPFVVDRINKLPDRE